ncbi:hypothetical protein AB0K14_17670 [Actinosynnema sp. NPDC050801]|uniref:hypothetical protein n=1 Tax=unclassified Actinosynnema TaxID=2637065 RepID=UPI00340A4EEC
MIDVPAPAAADLALVREAVAAFPVQPDSSVGRRLRRDLGRRPRPPRRSLTRPGVRSR